MKVIFTISLILILAAWIPLFSQGRIIDEVTYNALIRKASQFRMSTPFRERNVAEVCETDDRKWRPLYQAVTEVAGPGRMQSWFTDTGRGEVQPSSHSIFIDGKKYVNRRNTGWQIEPSRDTSGMINPKSELLKVEYRDLGIEKLDGENIAVLLRTTHTRLTVNGEVSDNVQTVRSWINAMGRLVKQEFLSRNSKTGATRLTMVYDLDPSIRVEAPIK